MSENPDHGPGIEDEDLPEDLRPTEDNPLAQPLDEDAEDTRSREELDVLGGKGPDESDSPHEADETEDTGD